MPRPYIRIVPSYRQHPLHAYTPLLLHIALLAAGCWLRKRSGTQITFICHPERSEGSPMPVTLSTQGTGTEILRFAQIDKVTIGGHPDAQTNSRITHHPQPASSHRSEATPPDPDPHSALSPQSSSLLIWYTNRHPANGAHRYATPARCATRWRLMGKLPVRGVARSTQPN
jgi:hypothetical protein